MPRRNDEEPPKSNKKTPTKFPESTYGKRDPRYGYQRVASPGVISRGERRNYGLEAVPERLKYGRGRTGEKIFSEERLAELAKKRRAWKNENWGEDWRKYRSSEYELPTRQGVWSPKKRWKNFPIEEGGTVRPIGNPRDREGRTNAIRRRMRKGNK